MSQKGCTNRCNNCLFVTIEDISYYYLMYGIISSDMHIRKIVTL